MKRPSRQADNMYHIKDDKYKMLIGSRQQVFRGAAYKTSGGLVKSDLMMNKWRRVVSTKKHETAKKERRLEKYGFDMNQKEFGAFRLSARKTRKTR